ncbi:MAG: SsrA-binding protein SmpB [Deltaproteobacteria bacterium]|nr:SsrA-binding protein SmpB [Deltaproteobacteria bacterium]
MNKGEPGAPVKVVAQNKKARFDYHIIETFEAGIVLTGAEIKSIRANGISLAESYIRPERDEVYLLNAHIKPYSFSSDKEFDPVRKRKLLLKKREIDKLRGRVEQKGLTIVPLSLYLKRGLAKLEIGLAKGKAAPDKRQTMKERESKRELDRALKRGK